MLDSKIIFLFLGFLVFSTASASDKIDLKSAYKFAVEKTEIIPLEKARTSQAEARASQATGRLLPQVSATASYLRQGASTRAGSDIARDVSRVNQFNSRVSLVQPIFRAREWNSKSQTDTELEAQRFLMTSARIRLFAQVAQAYYSVLTVQSEIGNFKDTLELTEKRITELKSREKIGRSREGEVLAAQAQLALVRSQIEALMIQRGIALDQFALVTGITPGSVLSDPLTQKPILRKLDSLEDYLNQLESRPDLLALKTQTEAAQKGVSVARSGHLPFLDFTSNYYPHRTGAIQNSKWDVGLGLTLPLFQGGVVNSQVAEAAERVKEVELNLARARREAQAELQSAYRNVSGGLSQLVFLEQSRSATERNYKQQLRDYRFGLVTNIEVLQALTTFQEAKRTLDRTHYQTLTAWANLHAAIGKIPDNEPL